MAFTISPPEQRVLLNNISWEMYENLVEAHREHGAPRFTYDRGQLEIMSPSAEHEELKDTLILLVNTLAEEFGINTRSFGSATFRRKDAGRGFEPDGCFYIQSIDLIRGKTDLDLEHDPPPDLIIEIDITHPSLVKFPIFAQLGIPEVWLYDNRALRIFHLEAGTYVERAASRALAGLAADTLTHFLNESRTDERLTWLRRVREWARGRLPA